jgi:hypothetical protein
MPLEKTGFFLDLGQFLDHRVSNRRWRLNTSFSNRSGRTFDCEFDAGIQHHRAFLEEEKGKPVLKLGGVVLNEFRQTFGIVIVRDTSV